LPPLALEGFWAAVPCALPPLLLLLVALPARSSYQPCHAMFEQLPGS
jgi:hypothetical protein